MTEMRAYEILKNIHVSSFNYHGDKLPYPKATADEENTIKARWENLPGWTSFADACHSLAYPHKWEKELKQAS